MEKYLGNRNLPYCRQNLFPTAPVCARDYASMLCTRICAYGVAYVHMNFLAVCVISPSREASCARVMIVWASFFLWDSNFSQESGVSQVLFFPWLLLACGMCFGSSWLLLAYPCLHQSHTWILWKKNLPLLFTNYIILMMRHAYII